MNFKKYFESLRVLQKIEVYLIVVIFYSLLFIYHKEIINLVTLQKSSTTQDLQRVQKRASKSSDTKISSITNLELVNYMTKQSKNSNIIIEEYKVYTNYLELKVNGSFNFLLDYLLEMQNHFYIISFEILENNDLLSATIVVKRNYFYEGLKSQKNLKSQKIENIFQVQKSVKFIPKEKIKIMAIINDEVLVDGIWYKKDDLIEGHRIEEINKKSIVLFDIQKKLKIVKELGYE